MGDDSEEALLTPSKLVRNIAPKARSLLIHGVFAKNATKVGIVATKASFILKKILQTEIPIPDIPQTVDRLLGKKEVEAEVKPEPDSPEHAKKKKDAKDLVRLVKHSQEVLAQATTAFPFTLFPDTMTVDRTRVTIHRRNFFFVNETIGVKIEDILNVSCTVGPVLGSITITIVMTGDKILVNGFWRNDAIFLKHVLQGSVIAASNKLDTNSLSREELISTLTEIGHDANG